MDTKDFTHITHYAGMTSVLQYTFDQLVLKTNPTYVFT